MARVFGFLVVLFVALFFYSRPLSSITGVPYLSPSLCLIRYCFCLFSPFLALQYCAAVYTAHIFPFVFFCRVRSCQSFFDLARFLFVMLLATAVASIAADSIAAAAAAARG